MSQAQDESPNVDPPPQAVGIASIDHALSQLWRLPGPKEAPHETITRACMSNLLIYCATAEEESTVAENLHMVVRLHPSRVILLTGDVHAPTEELKAYVSKLCHLHGGKHLVCSESVTVRSAGQSVQRLPSTARSLLLGDLPTTLWWASVLPPMLAGEVFQDLQQMTEQVIYSSVGWTDPVRGMLATVAWSAEAGANDTMIADLAWRKLEPWKRLIGQALDPESLPGAIDAINSVEIEHGPHGLTQAWLLVGWLASCLGWQSCDHASRSGTELGWMFESPHGQISIHIRRIPEGDPQIRTIKLGWNSGAGPASLTFDSPKPGHLIATGTGLNFEPRVLARPARSKAVLVANQLQDLERDIVFRSALKVAGGIAEVLAS